MPLSTSSSEPGRSEPRGIVQREGALPAGLRLTASDRPGQAQPVPTRDIPRQPWGRIMAGVAVALVCLLILQPDFGSLSLILAITAGMLVLGGVNMPRMFGPVLTHEEASRPSPARWNCSTSCPSPPPACVP